MSVLWLNVKLGGPSQAISESLWPRLRREPDHAVHRLPRQRPSFRKKVGVCSVVETRETPAWFKSAISSFSRSRAPTTSVPSENRVETEKGTRQRAPALASERAYPIPSKNPDRRCVRSSRFAVGVEPENASILTPAPAESSDRDSTVTRQHDRKIGFPLTGATSVGTYPERKCSLDFCRVRIEN